MNPEENKEITFDLPKNRSNVIKVLGVGGGGSNAINYMFKQGIKGVDFVISNTDAQALAESGVPTKIQLGASLTEGLGAGANPNIGAKAAQESQEEIYSILSTQTKMIFITAGMGGGTGTGAAPVIAQMAKSMDILTVGIVTMPFQFEGKLRLEQAQKGLEKIKESVDALIVINNNKLREVYGNLGFKAGFAKADEVLATAARGIAEVITHHYTQNIDLKDAKTVLTNSGTAIMGSGSASGSNRAQEAIVKALDSPLLNDNKIAGCKNVLLLIVSGSDEITIDEIGEINDFIQTEAGNHTNIIMGVGEDESLGNEVSVTVIATGFGKEQQSEISNTEIRKIIHTLEDDQKMEHDLSDPQPETPSNDSQYETISDRNVKSADSDFESSFEKQNEPLIEMSDLLLDLEVEGFEIVSDRKPKTATAPENEPSSVEANPINSSAFSSEEESTQEESKAFDFSEKPFEIYNLEDPDENSQTEALNSSDLILDNVQEKTFFEMDPYTKETERRTQEQTENTSTESEMGKATENTDEEEFIINEITPILSEIEVIEPEVIEHTSQFQLDFELPLQEHSVSSHKLPIEESNVIKEEQPLFEVHDEMALDLKFEVRKESESVFEKVETTVQKNHQLEQDKSRTASNTFDQSIDETLTNQSKKRKEHLKAFNHKFKHQLQRINDIESEPAYKRMGLDLENRESDAPSRLSLNEDGDDLHLRSNNSFLHDNVD
ncbi:MAG: cell division protein FtsZ [Flavobacteriaceae bacterium]